MRRITFAVSALAVASLAAAPRSESESDAQRLEGNWVMVSLRINGEDAADDLIDSARLVVEGNRYTPRYNDEFISETIKLDPGKTPKAIDFTYTEGPRKGEVVKGIYKLEGDRYTMCRPILAEDDRPREFASTPDSGLVLVVWKRDSEAERARRKAIDDDRKSIDGTWVGEFNQRDGMVISDDEVKRARLIITGDRYTLDRGRNQTSRGTNRIDPTRTPKTIDIAIIDGPNAGQNWLGIYEVSGDTYRSCFAPDGKARPEKFASEPGTGHVLWLFRREKP